MKKFAGVFAGLVLIGLAKTASAETTVLKIGTLAPAESPWGKVFRVWQKAVKERTNGAVELQFFWNGQQGDEAAMVNKIRAGQLDGAAITATGLGTIHKGVLVLQLPGLFGGWDKLDNARDKLKGKFDEAFEKEGFKNLGWGDVGAARIMTKGFEIRVPDDLKKKNVFVIKGEPVMPTFFSVIGDITPKEITLNEITPALTSGSINMVNSPALAAEQLQWAPQLDHINEMITGYAVGALVFSSSKFKTLPENVQTTLKETGKVTGDALTKTIRKSDDEAFARLKGRMKSYMPNPEELAKWKPIYEKTRAKLKGSTFKSEDVQAVEDAAK